MARTDASLTINRSEFICIFGHSGCGKSTIMNVLAGLDTATGGAVVMDGREVTGPSLDRGKELIHKKGGAGIRSVFDFDMSVEKVANPKGNRIEVKMSGKFLSYNQW